MNDILIAYASLTGVTMDIATTLNDKLSQALPNQPFVLKSISEVSPDDIKQYKKIIFGASTWDHGNPAPDAEEFLHSVATQQPDYTGITFALFGVGDRAYPAFCEAVPIIKEDLERVKATIYPEHFMIDGYPTDAILEDLTNWAKNFIAA